MSELKRESPIPRRNLKQNSILNLKNRVQEIVKENQQLDDLMGIWQESLLMNKQDCKLLLNAETIEAIVDEYNHKQRQLLTLGRLTSLFFLTQCKLSSLFSSSYYAIRRLWSKIQSFWRL